MLGPILEPMLAGVTYDFLVKPIWEKATGTRVTPGFHKRALVHIVF